MDRISRTTITAIGLLGAAFSFAQAPAAKPASLKFEVASLKPSQPGGRGGGIRPAPGGERYVATNFPLRLLIMVAYRVKIDQGVGGPPWIDTGLYGINAKAERSADIDQIHVMLQN